MADHDTISVRVSLLEQCQLRCCYCRPDVHAPAPPADRLPPEEWVRRIRLLNRAVPIGKLRFTGGEPLLYAGLEEIVRGCAALGLPDLALTTNGLRLVDRAADLGACGLRRVNISLDSLQPGTFRRITGGKPEPVLRGLDAAVDAGLRVKLNTVVMRGVNDGELLDLLTYASGKDVPIRFLEMMPIGPAASDFQGLYVSGQEMMQRLEEQVTFHPLPYARGETSRDFLARWPDGREAVCGFILPTSTPFCEGCRRLRLGPEGSLLGCLAQPDRLDLARALQAAEEGDLQPMREAVASALAVKRRAQSFETQQAMVQVGG